MSLLKLTSLSILLVIAIGIIATGVILLNTQPESISNQELQPTTLTQTQTPTTTPLTTTSDCTCYSYTLKRYIPCEQATAICRDGT